MRSVAGLGLALCTAVLLGPATSMDPEARGPDTSSAVAMPTPAATLVEIARTSRAPLGRTQRAALARWAGGGITSLGGAGSSPRTQVQVRTPRPRDGQLYGNGKPFHEFFFTRARYSGYSRGRGGRGSWAVDWPEADYTFSTVIDRFLDIDVHIGENSPRLDDPELRRFPFLYALEVGGMSLFPEEVEGLRSYLLQGGFLVIDDFWDTDEWWNFEREIGRVLPEYPIVPIPFDHPVLHTVYDVEEIIQVPNISNARRGGPTGECWGPCDPFVGAIFDEKGRMMVIIHFNTDLGDAWEHADDPTYPTVYSSYAFFIGMNMIVYALAN